MSAAVDALDAAKYRTERLDLLLDSADQLLQKIEFTPVMQRDAFHFVSLAQEELRNLVDDVRAASAPDVSTTANKVVRRRKSTKKGGAR